MLVLLVFSGFHYAFPKGLDYSREVCIPVLCRIAGSSFGYSRNKSMHWPLKQGVWKKNENRRFGLIFKSKRNSLAGLRRALFRLFRHSNTIKVIPASLINRIII